MSMCRHIDLERPTGRRALCSAIACALLAAGCGCAPDGASAAAEPAGPADTLVARRGALEPLLLLTGELEAVRSEKIYVPRTPLWRMPIRWMEQDGALVRKGQKILELDNTQFTGDLEQKKLSRSSAENDLLRKQADVAGEMFEKEFALEKARIQLEKARIQAAVPEALRPRRDYQEDQLELARAEVQHAKAAEDLETLRRASEAEIDELRIALERTRDEIAVAEQAIEALSLTAPRDGILVVAEDTREGRKLQVGDNVWVGLPVMSIPDLTAMRVAARLSDVDDGRIRVGDAAVCTVDAYPELSFPGRVTEIAPVAQEERGDSLRRSYRVMVMLDRSDAERMRPGMSVKIEIRPGAIDGALIVPRAALDLSGDRPLARLADGSSTEITLGPCTARECVVDEGLAEGARLRRAG